MIPHMVEASSFRRILEKLGLHGVWVSLLKHPPAEAGSPGGGWGGDLPTFGIRGLLSAKSRLVDRINVGGR